MVTPMLNIFELISFWKNIRRAKCDISKAKSGGQSTKSLFQLKNVPERKVSGNLFSRSARHFQNAVVEGLQVTKA